MLENGPNGGLLYERVADELAHAIDQGALRPGDRLPSVRRLSEQRDVSIATVLQAYLELENRGLIEVRPKSGHFVRARQVLRLPEPRSAPTPRTPAKISVSTGVSAVLATMRDPSIVPLGAALIAPELLPLPRMNRLLCGMLREMATAGATYDPPPGLPTLRRQLARRGALAGLALREDEFLTTVGAMEALHISLRAVIRPGQTVAVESPMYFGVLQLLEEMGVRVVEIPADPRTGMDLNALSEVLSKLKIGAVLALPNVGNPLGTIMPDEAKEQLMWLIDRHDVPLIEDDVYGDLAFDGTRPRPVKALDRNGRVLYCSSVSKTLAPGYRVGWVAAGRYQAVVERLKFTQSVASPTLMQMAVAEILASGVYDRHLRKLRRTLSGQVERMRDAIGRYFPAGTRVSAPRGGFVLWVEFPEGLDALALQARALEQGIAIAPGPIFSARGRFANYVRLSCGFPWSERIAQALERLGALAAEQLRKSARKSA